MLIIRKFARDLSPVVGLGIIVFAVAIGLFAEQLAPYPEAAFDVNIMERLLPPSAEHPFGTDRSGRDVLSRVILGTPTALVVARTGVAFSIIVSVPLGV